MSSTGSDGKLFSNIAATTSAFALAGGRYAAAVKATFGGGSVKLQVLLPDQTTWASVASATDFTADGFAVVDIPPGQYRFIIATATAVYAAVCRVPY